MCRPVACKICGKTTWAGCGAHVDQIMASVPKNQRCTCTPEEKAAARGGGFFSKLFGH